MKLPFRVAVLCLLLVPALFSMASKLQAQTRYRLSFPNPNSHLMEVQARFEGSLENVTTVNMPVWTPGSYLIREYSKNIEMLDAVDDAGNGLPIERQDKAAWLVSCQGKPFTVRYRIYCNELEVRKAHVDATHAFFTPASVLVYVKALADKPHSVALEAPSNWPTVSTPLVGTEKNTYQAKDLDELMDSPFELGSHTEQGFELEGVRYRLASYPGTARFGEKQLMDIRDVVAQANKVFGPEAPPVKEYLFFTHFTGGGGGLEHKFSCVLQGNKDMLGDKPLVENKMFADFLTLVGHEYFHLWNVKRIRPRRLGPFDYQQENYTTTLWFAEGFTSYYEDLLAARAGKVSKEEYLANLSGAISNAGSNPGQKVQSLEQASFEAWIKYYRPNENSTNATVPYYGNGSVVGWATDMRIRTLTKGAKSLDDLMRALWAKAKADPKFYADRDAITFELNLLCGTDQTAWLEGLVARTDFPDVESLAVGVGLLPIDHRKDRFWPTLGIAQQRTGPDRVIAGVVVRGGPAELAGVSYGDVLVSLDGKKITEPYKEDDFTYTEGQPAKLVVLRQGVPMTFTLNAMASRRMRWEIGWPGKKTPKELRGWIGKL